MATPSRPDVDSLENLTAAIIVDQERMGANARSTVGTATDAYDMLRVIFSRLGQPHIGPSSAFSFNVPAGTISGEITLEKGKSRDRVARDHDHRRHVRRVRGARARLDASTSTRSSTATRASTRAPSSSRTSRSAPGTTASTPTPASSTPTSRCATSPMPRWQQLLYGEETKVKLENFNLTYIGPRRQDPAQLPRQGRRLAPAEPPRRRRADLDLRAPARPAAARG